MRGIKFVVLFISTLISLFFFSCSAPVEKEEIVILPVERVIKRLEANRRRVRDFYGIGKIKISNPNFKTSASFKAIITKPDSIYLTIYGPFNAQLAQILLTSKNFMFYDEINRFLYFGDSNLEVLKNIFKIDIPFNQIHDAFIGSINLTDKLSSAPTQSEIIDNKYYLTFADSLKNSSSTYVVDAKTFSILEYSFKIKNQTVLYGKYEDFIEINNAYFPRKIYFKNNENIVEIFYDKTALNTNRYASEFSYPKHAKLVEWK